MKPQTVWVTRDGRQVPLNDMPPTHFHNLVVFLDTHPLRNDPTFAKLRWAYEQAIQEELTKRNLNRQQIVIQGFIPYGPAGEQKKWNPKTHQDEPI